MPNGSNVSVADWKAEGARRFGEDFRQWKWRCPICGNIATMDDFKAVGAQPQSAYQECIGRHITGSARDFAGTPGANGKKSPCDYAAYGLFRALGGYLVIPEDPKGKSVPVFPFAEAEPNQATAQPEASCSAAAGNEDCSTKKEGEQRA